MQILVSPGPGFTANPLFAIVNDELRRRGHALGAPRPAALFGCDLLHVNFPEHMVSEHRSLARASLAAGAMLASMALVKLRRRKIIWTVHNVAALRPRHPRLASVYLACVRRIVDGYVFLSQSSWHAFRERFPAARGKPVIVLFHPVLPALLGSGGDREACRRELGIAPDDFAVGYLGDIKAYKGPDLVPRIPAALTDGRRVSLVVAGVADLADPHPFEQALAARGCVRIARRLDDRALERTVQALDAVVLPYTSGWNSGFLMLLLACRQRCIASSLPIFSEMQHAFGRRWIATFDRSAADPADALRTALESLAAEPPPRDEELAALERMLARYDVASFVDRFERFHDRLRTGHAEPAPQAPG